MADLCRRQDGPAARPTAAAVDAYAPVPGRGQPNFHADALRGGWRISRPGVSGTDDELDHAKIFKRERARGLAIQIEIIPLLERMHGHNARLGVRLKLRLH